MPAFYKKKVKKKTKAQLFKIGKKKTEKKETEESTESSHKISFTRHLKGGIVNHKPTHGSTIIKRIRERNKK
jgi:hypothetical protein